MNLNPRSPSAIAKSEAIMVMRSLTVWTVAETRLLKSDSYHGPSSVTSVQSGADKKFLNHPSGVEELGDGRVRREPAFQEHELLAGRRPDQCPGIAANNGEASEKKQQRWSGKTEKFNVLVACRVVSINRAIHRRLVHLERGRWAETPIHVTFRHTHSSRAGHVHQRHRINANTMVKTVVTVSSIWFQDGPELKETVEYCRITNCDTPCDLSTKNQSLPAWAGR